jgi:hypothetical protein
MKTIAVISYNTDDFIQWKKSQNFKPNAKQDNVAKYVTDDTVYVCVTSVGSARGYSIDSVILTDKAKIKRDCVEILDNIIPQMSLNNFTVKDLRNAYKGGVMVEKSINALKSISDCCSVKDDFSYWFINYIIKNANT